jgi:hypothetical protein
VVGARRQLLGGVLTANREGHVVALEPPVQKQESIRAEENVCMHSTQHVVANESYVRMSMAPQQKTRVKNSKIFFFAVVAKSN